MQSTTLFGRSESGGELFKVRLVPYLHGATGQQFMFVRVTPGRCGCGASSITDQYPQAVSSILNPRSSGTYNLRGEEKAAKVTLPLPQQPIIRSLYFCFLDLVNRHIVPLVTGCQSPGLRDGIAY